MTPRYKLLLFVLAILNSALAVAQQGSPGVCPRDDKEFAAVQQRAVANDPVAQTALASCYDLGLHVQPDGKESIRLLTEAANQDYAPAEYELGRIYLYGRGIPVDYAKALLWERKAADHGDARAQRDLAFMYERGFGVPADPAEAAQWNLRAAVQGNTQAQAQLARALETGTGVQRNDAEALRWYRNAAEKDPKAQLLMARKLAEAPNTCNPALHWYKKAAEGGEVEAMRGMGELYLTKPCGVDRRNSYLWFYIAARFGSRESQSELEKAASLITPAQKKSAESKAEEWISKHPGAGKEEEHEEEKR
jgi:uncharacterized protein